MTVETDWAGIVACLSTIGVREPEKVRMLRATDMMHLERLYASEVLIAEARDREDLRVVTEPEPVELRGGDLAAPSPTSPE